MSGPQRKRGLAPCACALAVLCAGAPARAFVADGHVLIEVQAYKKLQTEGCAEPPEDCASNPANCTPVSISGDTVLRDFVEAGLLSKPICPDASNGSCEGRRDSDPLAWWPIPHSDEPDLILARQFSREGQCFHFMASVDNESVADPITKSTTSCSDPGSPDPLENVSCGLVCHAYSTCLDTLDTLAFNVVWGSPKQAADKQEALYELIHAVADSYSRAHVERKAGTGEVRYLRVWQPTVDPFGDARKLSRHAAPSDDRDDDYVQPFAAAATGHTCDFYRSLPYAVPQECLTEESRSAITAVKDLLCDLHAMRTTRSTVPKGMSTPQRRQLVRSNPWWMSFLDTHFVTEHRALCSAKVAPDGPDREPVPVLLVDATGRYVWHNSGVVREELKAGIFDTGSNYAPIVLRVNVGAGTLQPLKAGRPFGADNLPYLTGSVDMLFPLGDIIAIGTTPVVTEVGLGTPTTIDAYSRLLRLDLFPGGSWRNFWFGADGLEYHFLQSYAVWSAGLSFGGVIDDIRGAPLDPEETRSRGSPTVARPLPNPWDLEPRYAGLSTTFEVLGGTVVPNGNLGTSAFRTGVELILLKRNPWRRLNGGAVTFGIEQSLVRIPNGPAVGNLTAQQGVYVAGRLYLFGPFGATAGIAGLMSEQGVPPGSDQTGSHFDIQGAMELRWGVIASLGAIDLQVQGPPFSSQGWHFRTQDQLFAALLGFELGK